MKKSPSVVVLSIVVFLLAGCGNPDTSTGADAGTSPSEETSAPSERRSSAPSDPTPAPAMANPDPTPAPAMANPDPSTAPETRPSPQPEAPAEPIIESPAPAVPPADTVSGTGDKTGEPFVPPPPHAEYAPGVHADIVPVPTFDVVRVVRPPGSTWNVTGSGYAPGSEVIVRFGPARSDYAIIDGSAFADAFGHFAFRISLAPDLEPGSYGILTVQTAGLGYEEIEASKRFASVEVIAP